MRASTNIALRERRTLTLSDFKGVDFTSSPHHTAQNRATDMANLIYEDGVNRKRRGWRQRYRLTGCDSTDSICGLFEYKHGDRSVLLALAGNSLYGIEDGEAKELYTYAATGYEGDGSYRAQFIMQEEKCFIFGVCADDPNAGTVALVYDGSTVKTLDEIEPYIPTTTVGIGAMINEKFEYDDNCNTYRYAQDEPNLLTTKRKNTCVTTIKSGKQYSTSCVFELDAPIKKNSDVTIRLEGYGLYGAERFDTLKNEEYDSNRSWIYENTDWGLYENTWDAMPSTEEKIYLYKTQDWPEDRDEDNGINYWAGFIDWGGYSNGKRTNAKIYIWGRVYRQPDGSTSVTVEFDADLGADSRVGNCSLETCRYATTFGLDDSYLFLAGGEGHEESNCIYYSAYRDFTYFPATSYFYVGSRDVPVNGFLQMTDDTLAVLKPRGNDANIFYVTGDEDVNGKPIFKAKRGGYNEGNINAYTTASLAGDPLMLSENGVMGLTLSQNIATDVRYAKERSYSINRKLRELEEAGKLKDAAAIVYKNRYYLAVDGACFVADPRHKYTREGNDMDQSFNYEWWYWENVPASTWAIVDGVLWFGTEDGRVCSFDGEDFADETFFTFESGDITLEQNRIVFNEAWRGRIHEGDLLNTANFRLREDWGPVYCVCDDDIGEVYWSCNNDETFEQLYEGMTVKVRSSWYDPSNSDEEVTIIQVNRDTKRFYTDYTDRFVASSHSYPCTLYREYSELLFITDVREPENGYPSFRLKEFSDSAPLNSLNTEMYELDMIWTVYHREPVVARWVTPYFDMGSSMYAKTLLRLSVTPGQGSGHFLFGYESKRLGGLRRIGGIDALDFSNFSWENFSFDNDFATSHTVRALVRNFNYLRFRFLSEENCAFAVNSLSALYKINHMNKGVR